MRPPPHEVIVVAREQVATRTSLTRAGGELEVTVTAPPRTLAATFVSLPSPVLATAWGGFWLDPTVLSMLDLARLDDAGRRSFRIPAITVQDGVPLAFQAAVLANGVVRLTSPSVTVLRP